jgi:hypothetical protein
MYVVLIALPSVHEQVCSKMVCTAHVFPVWGDSQVSRILKEVVVEMS